MFADGIEKGLLTNLVHWVLLSGIAVGVKNRRYSSMEWLLDEGLHHQRQSA